MFFTSRFLYDEENGVEIILIEEYPCENKEQLKRRERYWIENIEGGCVNRYIPGRNHKEWEEDNKEHIQKKKKEYRQQHMEDMKKKDKNYYETNKERINKKKSEKITCECGRKVRRADMARHRRSEIHLYLCS